MRNFEKISSGFYQKSLGSDYEMYANVIKAGSTWTAEIRSSLSDRIVWRMEWLDTKRMAEQMVHLHTYAALTIS